MIRIKDIQNAFEHLIGWEQYFNPSDLRIDDDLTVSDSGLYFQQVHPLLTLMNLTSVAPDFSNMNYAFYNAESKYRRGDIVEGENGSMFVAVNPSVGMDLDDTDYWKPYDPFSEWLRRKTRASIAKAVMRFVNDKLNKGTYKNLFESRMLFDGAGRLKDVQENKSNMVGLELVPLRSKGVSTRINKIGLQFTKAGAYKVYIMHTGMDEPYRVLTLTTTKDNSMQWFTLDDVVLPYEQEGSDAGGSWYVCYNQNELPEGSQAIIKDRDWSKEPCQACSRYDYQSYLQWSKYLEVHPFYVGAENIEYTDEGTPTMWDIEANQYINKSNFGLNLDITVGCDCTYVMTENRDAFRDVIMKQVGVDFLREFAYNSNARANRNIINASKTEVLYELDGDSGSMKKSGLNYQLDEAFKAVELTFEGIDRACLPCHNNGVRYMTI